MFEVKRSYSHGSTHFSGQYLLRFFSFLLFSFAFLLPHTAQADGISWLEKQVNADGSYANALDVSFPSQSTAEVLRTYHLLSQELQPGLIAARTFIDTQGDEKTEVLSRKIIALAEAGGDTSALVAKLLLLQNRDGGFGDQEGYQSRVVDTAFALNALGIAQSTGTSDAAGSAVSYLLREQSPDGGFSHSSVNNSSVYETALASIALQHFRFNFNLTAAIDGASDYLTTNQQVAGGWDSVWETSYALLALVPVTSDVQVYQSAVDGLRTAQAADGSWNQDVYETALALRAIYKADNVQIPEVPTDGAFTGQVFNASNGQPLAGVVISLTDLVNVSATSSNDGTFSINGIPAGEHTVSYQAAGFGSVTQTALSVVGKFTSLGNVQLTPLPNKGVVFGVVRDAATSQPLPSITVDITASTAISVVTNADGYFSAEVDPGQVSLSIQATGYDPVGGSADIVAGQRLNFSPLLNATGTTPAITTVSTKATVVDANTNLPIQGASISIEGTAISGLTNNQGQLLLENIDAGSLNIVISATGYQSVSASTIAPAGSVIDLGVVTLQKAQIATKRTVKGFVTDAVTGNPISGATVNIEGTSISVITNSEGYYYIDDTGLASFNLVSSAVGYLNNNGQVNLDQPGQVSVNIQLAQAQISKINIMQIATSSPSYPANTEVEVTASVLNDDASDRLVRLYVVVIDSTGKVIEQFPAKQIPLGGNPADAIEIIPASITKEVVVDWGTGLNAPGSYQIKLQVIDTNTGQLLSEKAVQVDIETTLRIGGGSSFDPPIVQRVANTEVKVEAVVHNTGNQSIPAGTLTATVMLEVQGNERSTTFGEVTKSEPLGLTRNKKMDVDSQGNLYIAGEGNNKVLKISPAGVTEELILEPTLSYVNSIDVDIAANGKVYVLSNYGDIYEYDPVTSVSSKVYDANISSATSIEVLSDGRILVGTYSSGVFEIATDGTATNVYKPGMSQPDALVKDSQENLFISDKTGVIFKYSNGVLTRYLDAGLQSLRGMTIDAADNLYVADYGQNQVLKISPVKEVTVYADAIKTPWALSFDASGRLLVTSYTGNEIIAINPDGSKSTIVEETVNRPDHIVHGDNGSVYMVDSRANLIKFDAQGNKVALFNSGLSLVQDMLFESEGRILVLQSSRLYAVSGIDGSKVQIATGLSGATSISKSPDGVGYIISERGGKLTHLANDGSKSPYLNAAFSAPVKMDIAPNGDKYILNSTYITKINSTGQVSRLVEGLSHPQDMAIAANGDVYVTEYYNKRIIKVDATGAVTEYATLTFYPRKIAIKNDGSLIVLKNDNRTIFTIDTLGAEIQLALSNYYIFGMTVAVDDVLWVHHQHYSRISKVNSDGILQTFTGNYYPTAISPAPQGGVDFASYTRGVSHISNDGTVTPVYSNSLSNLFAKSLIKEGNNYWLLRDQNKLVNITKDGIVLNTYASTSSIRDFNVRSDGTIVVADSNNILKLSSVISLPVVLKSGSYSELNEFGVDKLLISTRSKIQNLYLNTGEVTPFVSGFSELRGFSVKADSSQIVTVDYTKNEVAYYDAQGTNQLKHVGLVNPKALLYTNSGKLIVSPTLPNRLMEVDASGNLSIFSSQSSITHLANLPNGKISASTSNYLNILSSTGAYEKRVGSFSRSRSALVANGTGWLAIADLNKLVQISVDDTTEILASGIGRVVDIETDSTGKIYLLDSTRKAILSPEVNGGLKLLTSKLSGAVSFAFDENDGLVVLESATQLTSINLASQTKRSVSSAPLIYSLTGVVGVSGELKAIGTSQGTSDKVIYTIGVGNSNSNISAGTVVYTTTLPNNEIVAGSQAENYDFGTFIPPVSGDYKVTVTHSDSDVLGVLTNSLHVGGAALGNIALSKDNVFPGDRLVAGSISITGADSTSVTKLEPENVVLAASSGTNGRAIASDSSGNIYAASSGKIVKVSTDGVVSDFVTGITVGNGLAVDAQENIYAVSGSNVLKITQAAVVTTHATLATTVVAVAIDYQNQLYAMVSNGQLVKINQDGSTQVVMTGISSPRSLSIDAFNNFYVLTSSSQILRLNPERNAMAIAYHEPGLRFEFEGVNVIADCSNNILFAPTGMPSVGFAGEERIIAQVTGNTGEARQIFYGPDVDRALGDMDVLFYDRFNDRVLVWTDRGAGKVFAFPVSCGGVDVEAHIIASEAVDVNGFDPAPTRIETLADGSIEYIWTLSQVDNRGASIDFNAQFNNMLEGERRKVFKDAFLLFTNSFVEGQQAKTPLYIPELFAQSQAGLSITTDKPSYIENQDVLIGLSVQNDNDALLNGNIKLEILDQSGDSVIQLSDIAVVDVPALGQVDLSAVWNTGLTLAGDYTVKAILYSATGLVLQTTDTAFVIQHDINGSNPLARLRITVDKPVYNTSDQVTIGSLSHNITANALISDAVVKIKVLNPDGTSNTELQQIIGDLASGNLRQRNTLQTLSGVPQGRYTVIGELLDASQTVLATDQTQFDVSENLDITLTGAVSVSQPSIYSGVTQSCSNTVSNTGTVDVSTENFRQVLVNIDTAIETLFDVQTADAILVAGQYQFVTTLDTTGLETGQYSCILQRQNGTEWVTLAYEFFKVDMLSLSGSLDATQYAANTPVNITLQVDNPSSSAFTGNIQLSLLDVNDNVVDSLTALGVLMPAGTNTLSLDYQWNTALTTAGNYKLSATLLDTHGQSIVTQNLPFEITAILQASLELTLDQSEYEPSDTVVMTHLVSNTTLNASLENAKLLINIQDETGTIVHTEELAINPLGLGGTHTLVANYVTPADLTDGNYTVISQVVLNGVLSEAQATFVIKPSIDIESSINADTDNMRLLVLLDDPNHVCLGEDEHDDEDHDDKKKKKKKDDDDEHDDDNDDHENNNCQSQLDQEPHGPANAPLLSEQRAVLEGLLDQKAWSYTIVTNASNFTRELRSGTYNAYALLSETIKLDEKVQKELREAVFSGEKLLVAGDHDRRNKKLEDALGIDVHGKSVTPSSLIVDQVETYVSTTMDFTLLDKSNAIELDGATQVASYNTDLVCSSEDDDDDHEDKDHNKKSKKKHDDEDDDHDKKDDDHDDDNECQSSTIAVTHYNFGFGHSVYAGFDLLANAAMPAANTAFSDLLLAALNDLEANSFALNTSAIVPVSINLNNLGIATPGQVIIPQPANTSFIDPGAAILQADGSLLWVFDLPVDEVKTLTFWLQLPDSANNTGTVDISAQVQAGTTPDLLDLETLQLQLPVLSSPSLQSVLDDLLLLKPEDKNFKKAHKKVEKAKKYQGQGKYEKVLKELLKASDYLAKTDHVAVTDVRKKLAFVIREIERQIP